jgi:hypothetical protein
MSAIISTSAFIRTTLLPSPRRARFLGSRERVECDSRPAREDNRIETAAHAQRASALTSSEEAALDTEEH